MDEREDAVLVDGDPLSTLFDAVDAVANKTNSLVEEGTRSLKGGKKNKKKKNGRLTEKHKFNNVDAKAFNAVVHHQKGICFAYNSDQIELSRRALVQKKIWDYLAPMNEQLRNSRVIFGFLRKRSSGRIQVFVNRWWFLISSRPLSIEEYIRDPNVLSENELPPLLEFDTMYYYYMDSWEDKSDCQGHIRTVDINNILLKDMSKSKEEGHAFILDAGARRYHMNCRYKFELERWVNAIYISMQTARESQASIGV